MSLEELKPEFIFAMCVAAGGAVWKAILMIFNWHDRLKAVESIAIQQGKDLFVVKESVEKQYIAVRNDIKEIGRQSEARHENLDAKIDMLINRELAK
jgi:hypothetical protein